MSHHLLSACIHTNLPSISLLEIVSRIHFQAYLKTCWFRSCPLSKASVTQVHTKCLRHTVEIRVMHGIQLEGQYFSFIQTHFKIGRLLEFGCLGVRNLSSYFYICATCTKLLNLSLIFFIYSIRNLFTS